MRTIGIVGPIGAGKSTIVNKMVNVCTDVGITAVSIDIDTVLKQMFVDKPSFRHQLVDVFGPMMVNEDFGAKRKYVLEYIFPCDHNYYVLMDILVPRLKEYIEGAKIAHEQRGVDLLFIEGVQLMSQPLMSLLDSIITVTASKTFCDNRVQQRSNNTEQYFEVLYKRSKLSKEFLTTPKMEVYCINTGMLHSTDQLQAIKNILEQEFKQLLNIEYGHISDVRVTHQAVYSNNLPPTRYALYAGSFNPLHVGHIAVVEDLLRMYDKVILLQCINGGKVQDQQFPIDVDCLPEGCELVNWGGAFIDYVNVCVRNEVDLVIARGIRNSSDLDYENNYIQHTKDMYRRKFNQELPPVIYISSRPALSHISSSSIRAILPFQPEYARELMGCILDVNGI